MNPRCGAQPQSPRRPAGNRDIYLRYHEYEAATRSLLMTTEGAFALPLMRISTLTKLQPSALFPHQLTALTLPALHPSPSATPLATATSVPSPASTSPQSQSDDILLFST